MLESPPGSEAQVAQAPDPLRVVGIRRQNHAAFAGGDQLVGVEAQRAQVSETAALAPDRPAAATVAQIARAVGFGRILDDRQPVAVGEAPQRIHVDRVAVDVDRQDRPRPRSDPIGVDVHAPGLGVGVDENRSAAGLDHRVGAGDDREGRKNDLVALLEPEREHRQVQCRCPARYRDGVRHPAPFRPPSLELLEELTGRRDPAGAQALADELELALADHRLAHRDHQNRSFSSRPV